MGVRGSGFRAEEDQPSSILMRFSRVGTGSAEKAGSSCRLCGGGNFGFLAFEDDAVKKPSAAGGAEHGRQHVGFCFVHLRKSKLKSIGARGAVPAGPLIFEGGDGADPGIGQARPAGIGVGDAIVEDFEHEGAGRLGGIAELVLELDKHFDAIRFAVAGPVFDLGEDRMDAHGGCAEEGSVGGGFEVKEGLAAAGEDEDRE